MPSAPLPIARRASSGWHIPFSTIGSFVIDLSHAMSSHVSTLPNVAGQGASPVMWLQTDDGAFTDVTNNQMLAAIPGRVGDGGTKTVNNATPAGTSTATTRVGKAPGATLKRFLVGPKECEITGITSTPDGKALFVNIQHPGENGGPDNITSNWPASQSGTSASASRPRSATIVITREDGGLVGI